MLEGRSFKEQVGCDFSVALGVVTGAMKHSEAHYSHALILLKIKASIFVIEYPSRGPILLEKYRYYTFREDEFPAHFVNLAQCDIDDAKAIKRRVEALMAEMMVKGSSIPYSLIYGHRTVILNNAVIFGESKDQGISYGLNCASFVVALLYSVLKYDMLDFDNWCNRPEDDKYQAGMRRTWPRLVLDKTAYRVRPEDVAAAASLYDASKDPSDVVPFKDMSELSLRISKKIKSWIWDLSQGKNINANDDYFCMDDFQID